MCNGVAMHAAFGMTRAEMDAVRLDAAERAALSIMFSEFEGAQFNWNSMEFRDRK
jgi:hypothetical protein